MDLSRNKCWDFHKMSYRKILNSPSTDIPNLQLHMELFLRKKNRKLARQPPPQQGIKGLHQNGWERQRSGLTKTPPLVTEWYVKDTHLLILWDWHAAYCTKEADTHLLILELLPEVQGPVGAFFGDRDTDKCNFCPPSTLLAQVSVCGHSLANTSDVPHPQCSSPTLLKPWACHILSTLSPALLKPQTCSTTSTFLHP